MSPNGCPTIRGNWHLVVADTREPGMLMRVIEVTCDDVADRFQCGYNKTALPVPDKPYTY